MPFEFASGTELRTSSPTKFSECYFLPVRRACGNWNEEYIPAMQSCLSRRCYCNTSSKVTANQHVASMK